MIVFSENVSSHVSLLEEVFRRLRAARLKLKPAKCHLFAPTVEYLGHIISADGVKTDPRKISAVREWPVPKHKSDVRAFLGTTGYYRRFIEKYAEVSKPLTRLVGKRR